MMKQKIMGNCSGAKSKDLRRSPILSYKSCLVVQEDKKAWLPWYIITHVYVIVCLNELK